MENENLMTIFAQIKNYNMAFFIGLAAFLLIYILIVKWDDFSFKKVDLNFWGIECPSNPYNTYSVIYRSDEDNEFTTLGSQHIMSNVLRSLIQNKWRKTPNKSSILLYGTSNLFGAVDEVIFSNDNNTAWSYDIETEKFSEKFQLPEKIIKRFNLPLGVSFPHHTPYYGNPRNS